MCDIQETKLFGQRISRNDESDPFHSKGLHKNEVNVSFMLVFIAFSLALILSFNPFKILGSYVGCQETQERTTSPSF